MAKNTQPVLKRCKTLGLSPAVLGYSKSTKRQPKRAYFLGTSERGLNLAVLQQVGYQRTQHSHTVIRSTAELAIVSHVSLPPN